MRGEEPAPPPPVEENDKPPPSLDVTRLVSYLGPCVVTRLRELLQPELLVPAGQHSAVPVSVAGRLRGHVEPISEITGLAIPAMEEAAASADGLCTMHRVLCDLGRLKVGNSATRAAASAYLCRRARLPPERTPAEFLELSAHYAAVNSGYTNKLHQVPAYDWLGAQAAEECRERLRCVLYAGAAASAARARKVAYEVPLEITRLWSVAPMALPTLAGGGGGGGGGGSGGSSGSGSASEHAGHAAAPGSCAGGFGTEAEEALARAVGAAVKPFTLRGIADVVTEQALIEVKCVHALQDEHMLQLALYAFLWTQRLAAIGEEDTDPKMEALRRSRIARDVAPEAPAAGWSSAGGAGAGGAGAGSSSGTHGAGAGSSSSASALSPREFLLTNALTGETWRITRDAATLQRVAEYLVFAQKAEAESVSLPRFLARARSILEDTSAAAADTSGRRRSARGAAAEEAHGGAGDDDSEGEAEPAVEGAADDDEQLLISSQLSSQRLGGGEEGAAQQAGGGGGGAAPLGAGAGSSAPQGGDDGRMEEDSEGGPAVPSTPARTAAGGELDSPSRELARGLAGTSLNTPQRPLGEGEEGRVGFPLSLGAALEGAAGSQGEQGAEDGRRVRPRTEG